MGAVTKPLVAGIKPYITEGLRAVFGKKGKLKKNERAIITRQSNKAAKGLNLTPAEAQQALRDAVKAPKSPKKKEGKFTPKNKNPLTKKDQGSTKGLTPKQKRERAKLIGEVEAEMKAANLPKSNVDRGRRRKTGPKGTPQEQLVEQGPLLSKVPPPEKVSKARRRQLVKTGQGKMGKGKGGKSVVKSTGEFAPPASIIAEEMGLRGRGKLPTAKEAEDFGLTVKKYGGKIKRNMGGPVRGVGKATRGFGKATYSNKMY